jgi:gamma-glutamyl-gamma-aminobutyrate hydrolase PuuD
VGSSGSDPAAAPASAPSVPPLIGLTTYRERAAWGVWDGVEADLLPGTYADAVLRAGGVPVLLPPDPVVAGAVDRLDAVVLCGGADVEPHRYGAERDPQTGAPRRDRDAAELAVLHRALDRGIPLLGVCRGIQVLNVGLGGTLRQHLPDHVGHTGHNPHPGVFGTVEVELEPGSRVHEAVGRHVRVQCHHHQGLDRLADGLVVTGLAADGTIEAVELADRGFVVGVQWHPEQEPQPEDIGIFAALVAAARERTTEREHV